MTNIFEHDDWNESGNKITSPANLERVKDCLEKYPIILQHWYYRGSRSPTRLLVDDFEQYVEYLKSYLSPGDIIEIWTLEFLYSEENIFLRAKFPDNKGRVPKKGAY